jgi:hypothetical protein
MRTAADLSESHLDESHANVSHADDQVAENCSPPQDSPVAAHPLPLPDPGGWSSRLTHSQAASRSFESLGGCGRTGQGRVRNLSLIRVYPRVAAVNDAGEYQRLDVVWSLRGASVPGHR